MFRKQIYNINVVAQSTLYRHVNLSLDEVFFYHNFNFISNEHAK